MNKIEELFYDEVIKIINDNIEKQLTLDDDEDVIYQFYTPEYYIKKDNIKKILVKRPSFPKTDFYIDSGFNFFSKREDCEIKGYYPDFLLDLGCSGYVVEIDGYEWHEKTKEQAINDRKKDRAYIKSGYIPIRFLGSEVYHDAKRCAREFIEMVIENEIHIFNRDSVQNISINKTKLEYDYKELDKSYSKSYKILNNCCLGFGVVKAFKFINGKIKKYDNAIELGRKLENEQ